MTTEQLELQIKISVRDYSLSKEARDLFYGQPGTGLIHQCALNAVVNYIKPLLEEIEMLKSTSMKLAPGLA
jgi:hypothetical protein